jgi:hypothetical protein
MTKARPERDRHELRLELDALMISLGTSIMRSSTAKRYPNVKRKYDRLMARLAEGSR